MFLDSSRTLPDTKEGLGNPDMSGILLDSPTLLLSWPVRECLAENFMTPPVWYGCGPPPGRVDGSTNSPAAWSTHLHQVCVQLLKGREFNTRSQTFSNPVTKFEADVRRVLTDPDSYRLCRPSLHEALARLYLTKGVNDSATGLCRMRSRQGPVERFQMHQFHREPIRKRRVTSRC
jgi:hypothetical protein